MKEDQERITLTSLRTLAYATVPRSCTQMATKLGVSTAAVTSIKDHLEKLGALECLDDVTRMEGGEKKIDRRKRVYRTTPTGHAILQTEITGLELLRNPNLDTHEHHPSSYRS